MCNNLNIQYFVMYVQYYLVIYSIILWYIACDLWCMCMCSLSCYIFYKPENLRLLAQLHICTPRNKLRIDPSDRRPSVLFFSATSPKPLDKISWHFVVMKFILCSYARVEILKQNPVSWVKSLNHWIFWWVFISNLRHFMHCMTRCHNSLLFSNCEDKTFDKMKIKASKDTSITFI